MLNGMRQDHSSAGPGQDYVNIYEPYPPQVRPRACQVKEPEQWDELPEENRRTSQHLRLRTAHRGGDPGQGAPIRSSCTPGATGFGDVNSAFAAALHMHQPLIPAGGTICGRRGSSATSSGCWTSADGDNHNAPVFRLVLQTDGGINPPTGREGCGPGSCSSTRGAAARAAAHGADDVFAICWPDHRRAAISGCNEWLGSRGGMPWRRPRRCRTIGFTCGPGGTISPPYLAWTRFAGSAAFPRGDGAAEPPGCLLRIHQTLIDAGYQWVLVQEHTVERIEGAGPPPPHLPRRLIARSSPGRGRQHHRGGQDPGQRHQAGRTDAAVLRGPGAVRRTWAAVGCRRWSRRSPTARTAAG